MKTIELNGINVPVFTYDVNCEHPLLLGYEGDHCNAVYSLSGYKRLSDTTSLFFYLMHKGNTVFRLQLTDIEDISNAFPNIRELTGIPSRTRLSGQIREIAVDDSGIETMRSSSRVFPVAVAHSAKDTDITERHEKYNEIWGAEVDRALRNLDGHGHNSSDVQMEGDMSGYNLQEAFDYAFDIVKNIKQSKPQSGVIYYSRESLTLNINGDTYDLYNDFNNSDDGFFVSILRLLYSGINLSIFDLDVNSIGMLEGLSDASVLWSNDDFVWSLTMFGFSREIKPKKERVTSLNNSVTTTEHVIETVGIPEYVGLNDLNKYGSWNLSNTGWYVFASISAPRNISLKSPMVVGAESYLVKDNSIEVAVLFGASPISQKVEINWDGAFRETFVFKATDLAIRNLDYRITYYVYDIKPYTEYEFAKVTPGETYGASKKYFRLVNDEYVTADDIPYGSTVSEGDDYYYHSKVTFKGFTRNVSYTADEIDCPVTIYMPDVNDDNYGCWFEIQTTFSAAFSVTFIPGDDAKLSQSTVTAPDEGINMINAQYHAKTKTWFMTNTVWKKAAE